MNKIIEFLFFRWKREIHARGQETWFREGPIYGDRIEFKRSFIEYKFTNKFDGSQKIKRKYLN